MSNQPRVFIALLTAFAFAFVPQVQAKPLKPKPATQADIERLEQKISEQQKTIEKLVRLQQLYAQSLANMFEGTPQEAVPPAAAATTTAAAPNTVPQMVPDQRAAAELKLVDKRPVVIKKLDKPVVAGLGTIVGKVQGAGDAIVYIDSIGPATRGTASMKQEGKQFVPQTLVVTKGTTVEFPNRDAIFHNVFSMTPDNSFDLGSYRQGESKKVTMSRPGVVTVYCNMHPQMVGNILVVPNASYVRAGKDGFFRLSNVPAGTHKIVAWAPNAKPVTIQATVTDGDVVTVELVVKKGRASLHTKKDGLPYGSYEK